MYKKDLVIENPKKFQRHVYDIASQVLFKRRYYLNRKYSSYPYLQENAISNIADFHGVLSFVKNHSDYNLISRIIGAILVATGAIYWVVPYLSSYHIQDIIWNPLAWIIIGAGVFLILFKFGKDVSIEIRLVGEAYRTDTIQDRDTIEHLNVRSDARLTVQAVSLDPTKFLTDKDIAKLSADGSALTEKLTPFLEKYLEPKKEQ